MASGGRPPVQRRENPGPAEVRADLLAVYRSATAAVQPARVLPRALCVKEGELQVAGRVLPRAAGLWVLAIGKAGGALAVCAAEIAGAWISAGLVVVPRGQASPVPGFRVCEAGHPLPDASSHAAAGAVLDFVAAPGPDDVLLVLLSGGASALLSSPQAGLPLTALIETTDALLRAGADIQQLNTVRKQLTRASGGRLALAAARAGRVEVLAISDVLGDDLSVLASGPFAPNTTDASDALGVLDALGVGAKIPPSVRAHLQALARGNPQSASAAAAFARVRSNWLARNSDAVDAAAAAGRALGWQPRVVSRGLHGEARDAGARLAALARCVEAEEPVLLVAGGETTVTVRGGGRGGRSQELALAAAIGLDGTSGITLLAAGTDGRDGPTDAAGAMVDAGSVARGLAAGRSAVEALAENDANGFFSREGGGIPAHNTGTNVMDLVLVLCLPAASRPSAAG